MLCYSTPMESLPVSSSSPIAYRRARHGVPDPSGTAPRPVKACINLGFVALLALLGLEHPHFIRNAGAHGPPVTAEGPFGENWSMMLARVRSNALAYSNQLPDFICNQTTRHFIRTLSPTVVWRVTGSFVAALSYYDKKEHYEIVSINQKPAPGATMKNLSGSLSVGEFGSALRGLFEHRTQAEFQPVGFKKINNIETLSIAFQVSQERSRRFITYGDKTIITAYRGRCWVDPDNYRIVRLEKKAVGIPGDFPVIRFDTIVDYAPVNISGSSYWLPREAEIWISRRLPGDHRSRKSDLIRTKSKIRFDGYRRFGTGVKLVTE